MSAPLPASELVPLLRDGFMAQDQAFMDRVMLALVVDLNQHPDYIEPFAHEALASCPPDVRAYWESPCDCGRVHLGGQIHP